MKKKGTKIYCGLHLRRIWPPKPVRCCRTIWCPGTDFRPATCTQCSNSSSWRTTRWPGPCWPWRCICACRDPAWAAGRNTSACRSRRFASRCNLFPRRSTYSKRVTFCKSQTKTNKYGNKSNTTVIIVIIIIIKVKIIIIVISRTGGRLRTAHNNIS